MEFTVSPESRDIVLKLGLECDIGLPDGLEFQPYQQGLRKGVDIAVLFDETINNPQGADAAFLRYAAGAYVPGHVHMGFESVLVLQGDYIENGTTFSAGSLIIRAPGTCHSMSSQNGCVILASRYVPVKQLTD
jgi:anti-sigma factor ChrR (cupin superfamily)